MAPLILVGLKKVRVIYSLLILFVLAGCGKAPQPVTQKESAQTDQTILDQPAPSHIEESGTPGAQWQSAIDEPGATPSSNATFKNQAANQAWSQYVEEYEALKTMPAPQITDPVNNAAQVTGYLQQLGARLHALQQSHDVVEQNLEPSERQRFKVLQKQMNRLTDDE